MRLLRAVLPLCLLAIGLVTLDLPSLAAATPLDVRSPADSSRSAVITPSSSLTFSKSAITEGQAVTLTLKLGPDVETSGRVFELRSLYNDRATVLSSWNHVVKTFSLSGGVTQKVFRLRPTVGYYEFWVRVRHVNDVKDATNTGVVFIPGAFAKLAVHPEVQQRRDTITKGEKVTFSGTLHVNTSLKPGDRPAMTVRLFRVWDPRTDENWSNQLSSSWGKTNIVAETKADPVTGELAISTGCCNEPRVEDSGWSLPFEGLAGSGVQA